MTKKLLMLLSALSVAAALTSCGSYDSQQDVTLPQETDGVTASVTVSSVTTSAPITGTDPEPAGTTTPEETDAPEETSETAAITEIPDSLIEDLTPEITATVTKNNSSASKKTTTTAKKATTSVVLTTKNAAQTAYKEYEEPATSLGTENKSFTAADTIIAKAASLLGTPYGWGAKGYTGIYNPLVKIKPMSIADIHRKGIDCSGLVFYTLTQLGYKTSGFMFCNPMPVDTVHWLSVNDGSTITYNGTSSKVDVEKKGLNTAKYEYWERSDGSTITPGSVVVGENLYDDNHAWIYMGEFESRDDVIAYLKMIGVPDSLITSKTVGDGCGSGGTHWRIESCGGNGVVINNNTERENDIANRVYNIYAFRITPKNTSFEIDLINSDGKAVGKSPVDGSAATYRIYRDKECKVKVKDITVGSDGKCSISLPPSTYYVKQLSCPAGYAADTSVYAVNAGKNKFTLPYLTGCIKIGMTSDDEAVAGNEFIISWSAGGKDHSQTVTTDSKGIIELCGLAVYDMSNGKEITYTVTMVSSDTEHYIYPEAQAVTLTKGDISINMHRECTQSGGAEGEGGTSEQ